MSTPPCHAAWVLLVAACWGCGPEPPWDPPPEALTSEPIVRPLAAPDAHAYVLELGAGEYAEIAVEQLGVDVAVKVQDPESSVLFEIDSPTGGTGTERVYLLAEQSGRYLIEVSLATGRPVSTA